MDPRFAEPTPPVIPDSSTISTAVWVNAEAGLKVANFELRFRIYNAFGRTIQNSATYLLQPDFVHNPLRYYCLSWRFLPQR